MRGCRRVLSMMVGNLTVICDEIFTELEGVVVDLLAGLGDVFDGLPKVL